MILFPGSGLYLCVYYFYNLVLSNDQSPCIGTYMVKKTGSKYYVMAPSEITDDLRKQAAADYYAKFMTADSYKTYTKAYTVFIKKNLCMRKNRR